MYTVNGQDYLELWKYFEDRADAVKQALFTTLTWTLGLASALLGGVFVAVTNYEADKAAIDRPLIVISVAVAGLVVCLYAGFILAESAKHIDRNWERAKLIREEIDGLDKILGSVGHDVENRHRVLQIWHQLAIIVVLYAVAFTGILIWAFLQPGSR